MMGFSGEPKPHFSQEIVKDQWRFLFVQDAPMKLPACHIAADRPRRVGVETLRES